MAIFAQEIIRFNLTNERVNLSNVRRVYSQRLKASGFPFFLFKLTSTRSYGYVTKSMHNIPFFKTRHNFFKHSFFPSTIIQWNKLDHNMKTQPVSIHLGKVS